MSVNLNYGMRILFPANPISILVPSMCIALSSSDNVEMTEFVIGKYWEDDTNANKYKVKLIPVDELRFGTERLYSTDLSSMIDRGTVKVL